MTELSPKTQRRACLLLGGVLLALSALLTWMFLLEPWLQAMDARGWPAVPCQILSSRNRWSTDLENGTASSTVEVQYRYRFEGTTYTSDRYDFVHTGTYFKTASAASTEQEIATQLTPGASTVCFVNPKNPGEAVLHRGLAWAPWFASATFPLVLFFAGTLFLVAFRYIETNKDPH